MFQGSKHVTGESHFQAARRRRRQRLQRHDGFRSHQLLRDAAVQPARAGALARVRPDGLPARRARSGQPGQPAGRRPQRAAPEHRERALRHRRGRGISPAVSEDPSVPRRRDRIARRHPGGEARGDQDVSSRRTTRRTTRASPIVGDIDKAKAKALVEKYFGPLKRGPDVPKITATTPPIKAERRAVVTDKVPLPKVYLGWITPAAYKPGDAEADLTGADPRRRQVEPAVQEARLRAADRAGRERLAVFALARIGLHDLGQRAQRAHGRRARKGDRRGAAEVPHRWARRPKNWTRARNTFETRIIGGLETLGGVADLLNRYNQLPRHARLPRAGSSAIPIGVRPIREDVRGHVPATGRARGDPRACRARKSWGPRCPRRLRRKCRRARAWNR